VVRVYEAQDVMELSFWPLVSEFEVKSCVALSWCRSRSTLSMLAVSTGDGSIQVLMV
jgi:hypothetical protein